MTGAARFHPAAWMVWAAASLTVVSGISNPLLLCVAIAALAFTAAVLAPQRGPVALMLKVGLVALIVRLVLFGLAGHPGGATLFTLPALRLPALLGGFRLGGAITAQVLLTSATEGLRLAAVLVCFGAVVAAVEPARLLRLMPRFLFEAGLVVAIGAAFVPSLVRSARDVREAQRLRGYRARGPRAAAALALPILSTTLERASAVAESMESRGYGRARGDDARAESRARAAVLIGVCAASAGTFAATMRLRPVVVPWVLVAVGSALLVAGVRSLSAGAARTRYRRDRVRAADVAMIAVAAGTAVAALVVRSSGALRWSAYPAPVAPGAPAAGLAVVALLAAPVAIDAARHARLRRASSSPVPEGVSA